MALSPVHLAHLSKGRVVKKDPGKGVREVQVNRKSRGGGGIGEEGKGG